MRKIFSLSVLCAFLIGGSSYLFGSGLDNLETKIPSRKLSEATIMVKPVSVIAKGVTVQDPQPPDEQPPAPAEETNKHCERPDPDNPEVGINDPDKLGCTCQRKCENGKPTENYEDNKRCRVHCKPDNCECPNPCKT